MVQKKETLRLGVHVSIAGGLDQAIIQAESIGCTTAQIFTKSNRQWAAKPLANEQIEVFKQKYAQSSVRPIVAHANYLTNIGSIDHALRDKSIRSLLDELNRCHLLDIPYLIIHPGSYTTGTPEECLSSIVSSLDTVLDQYTGHTQVLLENMAGQGSTVGYSLEQLAFIRNQTRHQARIGYCLDTCHAFAAGYDLRTPGRYDHFWQQFDAILGIDKLKVIHINDSKKDLGSRVDRHVDIGTGHLGLEPFRMLLNDERFFNTCKILETPHKEFPTEDIRNLTTLVNLIDEKNRWLLNGTAFGAYLIS